MNLIHRDVLWSCCFANRKSMTNAIRGSGKKVRVCECERPNLRGLEMTVALRNMLQVCRLTHVGTWCRLTDAPPWLALHPYRVKVRSHLPLFGECSWVKSSNFNRNSMWISGEVCWLHWPTENCLVWKWLLCEQWVFFALKYLLMWPHLEVCHTKAFSFQRGLWVKCEGAVGRAVSANSFWQITKK